MKKFYILLFILSFLVSVTTVFSKPPVSIYGRKIKPCKYKCSEIGKQKIKPYSGKIKVRTVKSSKINVVSMPKFIS